MAVQAYQSGDGVTLWKAYVHIKSKANQAIRIQRTKFGCKTEKQAQREETALIRECQAEISKRESEGSNWGAVVEAWENFQATDPLRSAKLNEGTRSDYVSCMRKHTGTWWKRPAASITRADVVEALAQLKSKSSSISYQNTMKVVINRIYTFGIDHRLIRGVDRSPAFGIELGRDEEKKPEILNIDQIRRLLSEALRHGHSWYCVWASALMTGMRNGELYALLWTDIDWENRQISVTKSYNCRLRIVKSTKSTHWRTVPMSDELFAFLSQLKQEAGSRVEVLPRLPRWANGEQARVLREFCEGTGLPSVKFHTLRACFATQLIRNGVPPIQIQKICGWRDLETMQRYIRLSGIEINGVTNTLRVLPDTGVTDLAAQLFASRGKEDDKAA